MTHKNENQLSALQLQLDNAIQMLRLVAASKRTCVEIEEWLNINYPENTDDNSVVSILLNNIKKGKN